MKLKYFTKFKYHRIFFLLLGYTNFLLENFIPYIFIWSGFTCRNTEFGEQITRITNGTKERDFRSTKKLILNPLYPAQYINTVVHPTLGQAVKKRRNNVIESSGSEYDQEDKFNDACKDVFKKKKKQIIKKKAPTSGFYQKESSKFLKYGIKTVQLTSIIEPTDQSAQREKINKSKIAISLLLPTTSRTASNITNSSYYENDPNQENIQPIDSKSMDSVEIV